ncbi:MAG: DUF167 domain-containing protein [Candidatus Magasanikbacteria bacterium]|jgi:hypothetical protein
MAIITIKVAPRASRNEVIPQPDGSFRIRLTAAPVDGKANDALTKLLAEHFDTSKSKIKIVRGLTSKNKVVEIN